MSEEREPQRTPEQMAWDILTAKYCYYVLDDPVMEDEEFDKLELEYRDWCDILGMSPSAADMVGFDLNRPSCQLVKRKIDAMRNINLRKRLRQYALKHNYQITIDSFIKEQTELADLGLEQPVCLLHTKQTLSRFPEFRYLRAGTYSYSPSKVKQMEERVHKKRLESVRLMAEANKERFRQAKLDADLEELFG